MFSAARWRLTIVFTAVLAVILVTAGVAVYLTTRSLIYDRVDAELESKAQQDAFLIPHDQEGSGQHRGPQPGDGGGQQFDPGGYWYFVVDRSGGVIDSSGMDRAALVGQETIQQAMQDGHAVAETQTSGGAQRVYVLNAPTEQDGPYLLEIGRSIGPEQDTLSQLQMILLIVVGVSVVPALVGGYALSGRVLRPIKSAVESQRTFIADASHELRTPVAVVRTNAELLERHLRARAVDGPSGDAVALSDILSESERLGKMVDQMLTLAQADAGSALIRRSEVALNEIVEETARSMKALAEAKRVELRTRMDGHLTVEGDRDRLRELLVILMDNAIKYTDAGGHVELAVERDHKKATVTISDTGHGIPAQSLPHIFERFYRVDKARSRESGGTGLGLAIARHIVDAHNGTIDIMSSEAKGTTVTVELPVRPSGQEEHA